MIQNPHIILLSAGFAFVGFGVGLYWTVRAALAVLTWKSQHAGDKDG